MNQEYYFMIYFEPPHPPKYMLTSKENLIYVNKFNSLEDSFLALYTLKNISAENLNLEIEENLFNEIKRNLGYNNAPYVIQHRELEDLLQKNSIIVQSRF